MKWTPKTMRCVRRFALFPKKLFDLSRHENYYVWLEVYYVVQVRYSASYCWSNRYAADKETWLKWGANHEGVH